MKKTIVYVYGKYTNKDMYYANERIAEVKIGEATVAEDVDKYEAAMKRITEQARTGMSYPMRLYDVFEFPEHIKTDDAIRSVLSEDIYCEMETSRKNNSIDVDDPYYIKPGNEWVYDVTRNQIFIAIKNYTTDLWYKNPEHIELIRKYTETNLNPSINLSENEEVCTEIQDDKYTEYWNDFQTAISNIIGDTPTNLSFYTKRHKKDTTSLALCMNCAAK